MKSHLKNQRPSILPALTAPVAIAPNSLPSARPHELLMVPGVVTVSVATDVSAHPQAWQIQAQAELAQDLSALAQHPLGSAATGGFGIAGVKSSKGMTIANKSASVTARGVRPRGRPV